jgi:N6-adenosine-specific RNA methylase IME4
MLKITAPRRVWAKKISRAWVEAAGNMVKAIFAAGNDLRKARAELSPEDYAEMIEHDLPFGRRTAQRFVRIAIMFEHNPELVKTTHASLPPSWDTLYQLASLTADQVRELREEKIIRPDLERHEIATFRRLKKIAVDEERIMALQPVIGKFRTIVLDPAWNYDLLSIAGRAKPGYKMQTHEELLELDVKAWAEEQIGCHLYLWTTNNFMGKACELVNVWGFQHRTVLTWIKEGAFGLGSYFRNSTEHVIFATLGETTTRHEAASIPTHFFAKRGDHSEKPEEFYDIVRKASYPPYGEGNQIKKRSDFVNLFEEKDGRVSARQRVAKTDAGRDLSAATL